MKEVIKMKMEILGGLTHRTHTVLSNSESEALLTQVKERMQALPEQEVIDFIAGYGGAAFTNRVFIPVNNKPDFFEVNAPVVSVIGWHSSPSALSCIDTYYRTDRINTRFFPLFEGAEGDIVYYSLEPKTRGFIYYWHPESPEHDNTIFLASSFDEFIQALYSHEEMALQLH